MMTTREIERKVKKQLDIYGIIAKEEFQKTVPYSFEVRKPYTYKGVLNDPILVGNRDNSRVLRNQFIFLEKESHWNASASDVKKYLRDDQRVFVQTGNDVWDVYQGNGTATPDKIISGKSGLEDLLKKQIRELMPQPMDPNSPLQQIFYGAPGTGKSYEIKKKTKGDDTVIRTTFHPDSDYSTFVGCYKPTMINKEPLYGVGELINKLSKIKAFGVTYPCHKFAARYWESLKDLSTSVINNILTACGFTASMNVEISKGIAIGEYFAKKQENKKIAYTFVPQAFTKAYVQAWKKMCDTSLWAKKAAAMSPKGKVATPYKRTGKTGAEEEFVFTPDGALTDDEMKVLLEVDNFDFPFDGYDNFGKLRDKKGIKVIVTDLPTEEQSKRYRKTITLTAAQIRDLVRKFLENRNIYWFLESLLAKILEKLGWSWRPGLDKLKDYTGNDITIEVEESDSLLGLYNPMTKTVYLFKENIGNDIMLLCATYIHEMFHAYYDTGDKYIPEIEEPIVECNTLCFLELFDKDYMDSYITRVERKQGSDAINYYGFGAHLFENRSLDWMRLYQNAYNHIDDTSTIVNDYMGMFSPIYPFGNEEETSNLLYMILKGIKATTSKSSSKEAQFLIIEEINRGNCAQIFGDLFQLLDRNEYGYSEYPIVADDDLKKILAEEFNNLNFGDVKQKIDSIFKEDYPSGIADRIQSGELLVLPKNLFIWATMNTSDQSLFPIDSAFKRRWEWKYVPIHNCEKGWRIEGDTNEFDWWLFLKKINNEIDKLTHSEDKKLGYFFCKADNNGVISADKFVSKVIFYLWNDVFKDYDFEGDIFKDGEDGKLSFNKFYDVDGNGNTVIRKDKVQLFLEKNLNLDAVDEEEDEDGNTPSSPSRNYDKFSIDGKGKYGKNLLATECLKEYIRRNPKMSVDDVLKEWETLGTIVSHFIESKSVYDARTDSNKHRSSEIPCDGTFIYVAKYGYGKKGEVEKLIDAINNKDWGLTLAKV